MSEIIAEGFKPEMLDVNQYCKDHPDQDPKQVQAHFMEQAQKTTNWANFVSTVGAFSVGLDPVSAYSTGKNAVDNNWLKAVAVAVCGGILMSSTQYWRDLETDPPHVALGKMGISAVKDAMLGRIVFEVVGIACYTLKEATLIAAAKNPALKNALTALESRLGKIEAYFKDQFEFQKHFEAEKKLHIGGKFEVKDFKFGKGYSVKQEAKLGEFGRGELPNVSELWKSKYWTESAEYSFKGQTNKVYQRNDLFDPKYIGKDGRTNLERMLDGKAPIGIDGKSINLHHSLQNMDSPLVELTDTFHSQYTKIIHINPNSITSSIDRPFFKKWKPEYWMQRAKELGDK